MELQINLTLASPEMAEEYLRAMQGLKDQGTKYDDLINQFMISMRTF